MIASLTMSPTNQPAPVTAPLDCPTCAAGAMTRILQTREVEILACKECGTTLSVMRGAPFHPSLV
jgi:hypothetical protein